MISILLIVPKCTGPGNGNKWNSAWPDEIEKIISQNMWKVVTPGILVLSALTDKTKFEIDIVDEEFQSVDENKYYDIVAMYTVTSNAKRAYMWSARFKAKGAYIVLGGVHSSVCTSEACDNADTVLVGEVENIWPNFLNDFMQGKAKRIYIQPVGQVDIDISPIPDFSMLPQNARKIIPIQTARGCPHGCEFCNIRSLYGHAYRAKTIDRLEMEMCEALSINPRATIYFTDDNFFCDKKRAVLLLDAIKKYNVAWYAHTDLSFGYDEMLIEKAYQSGCRQVLIGLESINPSNLEGIDENNFKNKAYVNYKEVINRIQTNGIGVIGSFIIGLDEDDHKIFDELLRFINGTHIYGASITICTPYPGTKLFEKMKKENRIMTYDWDKYTIFEPIITPAKMTVDELNNGYIKVLHEIYSLKNIVKRLEYFKNERKLLKGDQSAATKE
ncbi:MAG: B12-binding domain-containing radical SAM protein [Bacillota bacterium]